jgi:hypothetical protein
MPGVSPPTSRQPNSLFVRNAEKDQRRSHSFLRATLRTRDGRTAAATGQPASARDWAAVVERRRTEPARGGDWARGFSLGDGETRVLDLRFGQECQK